MQRSPRSQRSNAPQTVRPRAPRTPDAAAPGPPRSRSPRSGPLGPEDVIALQRTAGNQVVARALEAQRTSGATLQRMKIRGAPSASTVAGPTAAKHIAALDAQEATAKAEHADTTFVTSAAALTGPVDAHDHDFVDAATTRSARFDFTASVPVHQYRKTAGFAKGAAVEKSIDGVATNCEIGVVKTGADALSITHFMKL